MTDKSPPDVIWICIPCWKQRQGNKEAPAPIIIDTCADCGLQNVSLVYVKIDPAAG